MSTKSWGSTPTTWRQQAKRAAVLVSFATTLAAPALAYADEPKKDCEPGSWFCGETEQGGSKDLQPLPAEKPADTKPADKTPPPVVVYQPPPPTVVVQPRDAPPAYYYVPRKAPPKKEWGLNLHLGGAMMGKGRDGNAGMGMAGLGLRFRPIPQAAIEGDLDFAAGRDYNGYRRGETAFTLNGLIFLNPKNTTQVYLLGGFGWSGARAVDDRDGYDKVEYKYGYFGVQAGIGLEFRLSKVVALNVDLRGLIRGRVDDNRRLHPEFVSNDGKSTNTSGAGLLQGGLTFYW
ncbi:MAG: hypothetical protein K0S65_6732 [Labilithrix sp.]|nr:hypothetical protein [Labilithrix sp.]